MTYDGSGSVHALRLRITKLDLDGSPLEGANNMLVTDALVKLSWKFTKTTGDQIEKKNAQGIACVSFKQVDTVNGLDLTLELCSPDPEKDSLLIGGALYQPTAGVTKGWAAPAVGADPVPNGVSIEAWSRAVIGGSQASTDPYIWWVLPKTKWTLDEAALENDAMGPTYTGVGYENSGWGNGPANDWPSTALSSRLVQYVRTSSLPDVTTGLTTVPVGA